MAGASLTVLGIAAAKKGIKNSSKRWADSLAKALKAEGMEIMKEAKPITPVDKNPLINSGFVSKIKKDSRGMFVLVGFGKKYALIVHEMPVDTKWSKFGSGPKYLEKPYRKRLAGWKRRIANNTRAIYLGKSPNMG